jgi:hypothetical protein
MAADSATSALVCAFLAACRTSTSARGIQIRGWLQCSNCLLHFKHGDLEARASTNNEPAERTSRSGRSHSGSTSDNTVASSFSEASATLSKLSKGTKKDGELAPPLLVTTSRMSDGRSQATAHRDGAQYPHMVNVHVHHPRAHPGLAARQWPQHGCLGEPTLRSDFTARCDSGVGVSY